MSPSPASVEAAAATDGDSAADVGGWDGDDDPRNPMNWSTTRRVSIIALVTFAALNDSIASTIFSPAVPHVLEDFEISSASLSSFLISIHAIGFTIGPFLCPASEVYGRSPMMHASNILFVLSAVLCAASVNIGMLIAGRIIMGLAGCVPAVLGGGYIADLIPVERRGGAIAIWACGYSLGSVIGPIIGGYLAERAGWRWTFWLEVIVCGLTAIATVFILRETYGPVILQKIHAPNQGGRKTSSLWTAFTRPLRMLTRSPVVILSTFYISTAYVYLYFLLTTFPTFFGERYGFSEGQIGLTYLGPGIGLIAGQLIFGHLLDRHFEKQRNIPEDRLKILLPGNLLMVVGLFWYGWTAQAHTHWALPLAGTAVICLGVFCVGISTQSYLTDAFELFAASALAANTIVRSLLGAVLPLCAPALYGRLGYGWGNSLLGFIVLAFVPATALFIRFGERMRLDARFHIY